MKNISNLVIKILSIGFSVVAIILLAIAVIWGSFQKEIIDSSELVEGVISDVKPVSGNDGIDYRVSVKYNFNGTDYKRELSEYSSSMYEGKSIELYVEKENPENAHVKSLIYLGPIIVSGIGAIFFIIAIILIIIFLRKKKHRSDLISNGNKVYAEITGGIVDYSTRINGRNPYRLNCEVLDIYSGQKIIYSSGQVLDSPENYVGRQVAVYVDKKDNSKYYVDVESIKIIL